MTQLTQHYDKVVQQDYFLVCIAARFAKGRLGPNLIKGWSITELEQLKSLSLKIQETTSKSVAITEKLVTLRNK